MSARNNLCLLQGRDFQGAAIDTTAALEAIGVEKAFGGFLAFVWLELHRTDCRTLFAARGAACVDINSFVIFRQLAFARCNPRRECAHGAERAPCARSIDERQCAAYPRGDENYCPEYAAHGIPVAPCTGHLYAEHGEDEQHHENPESARAHKLGNRPVRRIFRENFVIKTSAGTCVAAPPAALADSKRHRSYHADKSQKTNHRIENSDDKVDEQNPVKRKRFFRVMTEKFSVFHSIIMIGLEILIGRESLRFKK